MPKIKYVLLLLGFSILSGCDKSKNELGQFPRTYYVIDMVKAGEPVFYLDGQVSTDKLEKEGFLKGESIFNEDNRGIDSRGLVLFNAKDEARFGEELEDWEVQREGSRYVFIAKNYGIREEPQLYKNLSEMVKYRDESPLVALPSGSGGMQYMSRSVRIAYGDEKELEFPYFAYKWEHSAQSLFVYTGTFFNEFNEDFLLKNRPTEKLAIQKYMIRLKVK